MNSELHEVNKDPMVKSQQSNVTLHVNCGWRVSQGSLHRAVECAYTWLQCAKLLSQMVLHASYTWSMNSSTSTNSPQARRYPYFKNVVDSEIWWQVSAAGVKLHFQLLIKLKTGGSATAMRGAPLILEQNNSRTRQNTIHLTGSLKLSQAKIINIFFLRFSSPRRLKTVMKGKSGYLS